MTGQSVSRGRRALSILGKILLWGSVSLLLLVVVGAGLVVGFCGLVR